MQPANKAEITEALTGIFRDIFENPALVLRDDMTAADVERWDSLNHIDLIVAIESRWKIRFTTREIAGLKNVGGLAALIQRKLGAGA